MQIKRNIISLIFWISVWQVLSMVVGYTVLLPSPTIVLVAMIKLIFTSIFWETIAYSSMKIFMGYFGGIIVGIAIAILSFKSKILEHILHPAVLVLKSTPVASFIIVLLIWVSSSSLAMIVCVIMTMPIIYTNMRSAFAKFDIKLNEMSKVFELSKSAQLKYIYFPQILPYFKSACIIAVGLCFKSGITAEIIGLQSKTIGESLYNAKIYLDTPNLFAWTIIIIILSFIFEKITILLINCLEG